MNLDQDIRTMLRAQAEGVAAAPEIPHATVRRVRVRKMMMTGGAMAGVAALIFGGFVASGSLWNDAAPPQPADGSRAVTFSFPDVEVSLHAAEPWAEHSGNPALVFDGNSEERLGLDSDPRSVGTACQPGVAPDAQTLARDIRSDTDLEATAPVAVSVGGVDALQMDVTTASGTGPCSKWGPAYPAAPMVLAQFVHSSGAALEEESRMRLYLLDTPWRSDQWSRQVFALWIVAPEERFERVVEAARPILDSIEFHAP